MSTDRRRDRQVDDANLDSAWRAASRDEPPESVDAAILAAARAELGTRSGVPRRRHTWWSTWQPLAAAAGVAGLAFVLVQTLPEQMMPEQGSPRAPAVSEGAPATPPSSQRQEWQPQPRATVMPSAPVAAAPKGAEPARESEAPAFAPSAPGLSVEKRAAGASAEREVATDSSAAGVMPRPAERPAPGDWTDRIVSLYEAGDLPGAAVQLTAFRQAYPDADRHLPAELRDWAGSVPAHPADPPP